MCRAQLLMHTTIVSVADSGKVNRFRLPVPLLATVFGCAIDISVECNRAYVWCCLSIFFFHFTWKSDRMLRRMRFRFRLSIVSAIGKTPYTSLYLCTLSAVSRHSDWMIVTAKSIVVREKIAIYSEKRNWSDCIGALIELARIHRILEVQMKFGKLIGHCRWTERPNDGMVDVIF